MLDDNTYEARARSILVSTDTVYNTGVGGANPITLPYGAGDDNLSQLATGALAFITDKGVLIDPAAVSAASFTDVEFFQIAIGDQVNGYPKISAPIRRVSARMDYKGYVANVAQAKVIGNDGVGGALNLPVAAKGNVLGVMLQIDNPNNTHRSPAKRRIEYVYTTADTNLTAITNLIARINKDFGDYVTATVQGAQVGIVLTLKNTRETLTVGVNSDLSDATITIDGTGSSILPIFGNGSAAQIAQLELSASTQEGNTSQVEWQKELYSRASTINVAKNYDQWVITWEAEHKAGLGIKHPGMNTLILALPTDYPDAADPADYRTNVVNTLGFAFNLAVAPTEEGGES